MSISQAKREILEQPKSKCLTSGCSAEAKTRGICQRCYSAACTQVKKGNVTWEKLVELGLVKPSSRETGARDLFNLALARALRGEAEKPEEVGTQVQACEG